MVVVLCAPFLLASSTAGFVGILRPAALGQSHQRSFSTRCNAKRSKNAGVVPPENEFSRTLRPDRILKSTSQRQRNAGYQTSVKAEPNECQALADRFDLSDIASLAADLTLRPNDYGNRYFSTSASVQVEGTCRATVTQRCVRTNEDFQINLEFPLYCVVRPVVPLAETTTTTLGGGAAAGDDLRDDEDDRNSREFRRTEPRGGKTASYSTSNNNLDEMDVLELQKMLQADLVEAEDVLMEDESIYSTGGLLDVGELVAQLFWLELDPYPKKPGTGPIQRSITG